MGSKESVKKTQATLTNLKGEGKTHFGSCPNTRKDKDDEKAVSTIKATCVPNQLNLTGGSFTDAGVTVDATFYQNAVLIRNRGCKYLIRIFSHISHHTRRSARCCTAAGVFHECLESTRKPGLDKMSDDREPVT
jgi:hypothetical protein